MKIFQLNNLSAHLINYQVHPVKPIYFSFKLTHYSKLFLKNKRNDLDAAKEYMHEKN